MVGWTRVHGNAEVSMRGWILAVAAGLAAAAAWADPCDGDPRGLHFQIEGSAGANPRELVTAIKRVAG